MSACWTHVYYAWDGYDVKHWNRNKRVWNWNCSCDQHKQVAINQRIILTITITANLYNFLIHNSRLHSKQAVKFFQKKSTTEDTKFV